MRVGAAARPRHVPRRWWDGRPGRAEDLAENEGSPPAVLLA